MTEAPGDNTGPPPTEGQPSQPKSKADRFVPIPTGKKGLGLRAGYAVTDDGHWVWAGKILKGYPVVKEMGRYVQATRVMWRQHYGGDLPDRSRLRRLCDIGACVRPQHFTIAAPREAILRHGRNMEELAAMIALLRFNVTQVESWQLCWEDGLWALDHDICLDLAASTGSPLWVVHAAFSSLCQQAKKGQRRGRSDPAAAADSQAAAKKARSILRQAQGNEPQNADSPWLPKL